MMIGWALKPSDNRQDYDSSRTHFHTQRMRDVVSVNRVLSPLLPSVTMMNWRSPRQKRLARQPPAYRFVSGHVRRSLRT